MTTNKTAKAATYIRYQGVLYQLHEAGGLGTTREHRNFTLIEKDYPSDVRELRFEDGQFVFTVGLKFPSKGPYQYPVTLFIDEEEAAALFRAMVDDGGKVGREFPGAWKAGALPPRFLEMVDTGEPRALPEPQQATGSAAYPKKVVALLRSWEGEQMLRVPPDEEVATVTFNVCPAGSGFSLGGYDISDATPQEVEELSHALHIELTRKFPAARIDTSITDDAHCGYPIVRNAQGTEIRTHMKELTQLAFQLWRGIYHQR